MLTKVTTVTISVITAIACGKQSSPKLPDAAPLAGDFSCAGVPWPTSAPDPLIVSGQFFSASETGLNGVPVEVRDAATDAVLATGTTAGTAVAGGVYHINVTTGGTAPTIYRKASASGYLDEYLYDAIPESDPANFWGDHPETQAVTDANSQMVGIAPDATKGNLDIEINDCGLAPNEHGVEGATIEVPPGAGVEYADSTHAPDPSLTATSSAGEVALYGLTPGEYSVTVHAGPVTYRDWPVRVYANAWTVSSRKP